MINFSIDSFTFLRKTNASSLNLLKKVEHRTRFVPTTAEKGIKEEGRVVGSARHITINSRSPKINGVSFP